MEVSEIVKEAGIKTIPKKQNLECTRTQKKELLLTDADLPVTVQESLVEALVGEGLLQGWGH